MLLVKTFLANSPIHGIGVFAAEPIEKGQVVCRFVPGFDSICLPAQYAELPESAQSFLRCYGFPLEQLAEQLGRSAEELCGGWALEVDNMRFCNHSDTPNLSADGPVRALRDIRAGEELFQCYFDYNPGYEFLQRTRD
jgi:hypothetical protein